TAAADDDQPAGTSYPAVSAIEKKLFSREFAQEPVKQRLARLETKVFGKPSTSDDLLERVDRLKQTTGIDVTRQAPPQSDWAEDDDDTSPVVQQAPLAPMRSMGGDGEDGKSFSGRDIRQDMQKAFGMPSSRGNWTGGGAYGMGSGGMGGGIGGGAAGAY